MAKPPFMLVATVLSFALLVGTHPVAAQDRRSLQTPAEDEAYSFLTDQPFVVEGQLSPLGGPLGLGGMAFDVSVLRWLALDAGIGAGNGGPQMGASVRPRIPVAGRDWCSIGAMIGYSRGKWKPLDLYSDEDTDPAVMAEWLNVGITFEMRFEHMSLRFNPGVSIMLSYDVPAWRRRDARLLFVTVAPGVAF